MNTLRRLSSMLAGVLLTANIAIAQDKVPRKAQEFGKQTAYFPLFSDEMIRNASPVQAARMRESEAGNRARFDARQQARREDKEATEEPAEVREPRPAPVAKHRHGKVYKWVDANGRVHFGDAPQGRNAREVKVGGAARIKGTPPPAPGAVNQGEDIPDKN
jgi:hypothetical protein